MRSLALKASDSRGGTNFKVAVASAILGLFASDTKHIKLHKDFDCLLFQANLQREKRGGRVEGGGGWEGKRERGESGWWLW